MNHPSPLAALRSASAAPFAWVAVLFCAARQHVHITWTDPVTYTNILRHKCGITALLCVTWALAEARLSWVQGRRAAGWQSSTIDDDLLADEGAA